MFFEVLPRKVVIRFKMGGIICNGGAIAIDGIEYMTLRLESASCRVMFNSALDQRTSPHGRMFLKLN